MPIDSHISIFLSVISIWTGDKTSINYLDLIELCNIIL